ncbi:MAG: pyridoxal-dependent decarboxylase [Clostridium sp.]|nr:pyridoxal-dependent decarboxylase [Clostridium sp.]
MLSLSSEWIKKIERQYGESFYLLDTGIFKQNFLGLQEAMHQYYPKVIISYSYKTNYIPRLCSVVNELGGYAEVVSDMERELALRLGVPHNKIVFNGPYKKQEAVEQAILAGEIVNIDSQYDFSIVQDLAKKNPKSDFTIGIRCNFDVNDGVRSRFGFDIESDEFMNVLYEIDNIPNLRVNGLHCHFASRNIDVWKNKVSGILDLVQKMSSLSLDYISVGGGIFGKMEESLKQQFTGRIPDFGEYAEVIAKPFAEYFKDFSEDRKPILFLEPGSALAGDAMRFAAKIVSIKNIRGEPIATLLGSVYNINPTLNGKNPPIQIVHSDGKESLYTDLDFAGYTCIESDYLYRGYTGNLAVGDYVVFGNIGSYSVVLKPPFILPNFPVLELEGEKVKLVKRAEVFEDIFGSYML